MTSVRTPAVAGLFYPEAAAVLHDTVTTLLAEAADHGGPRPRALIVPHAGYVYSGRAAAAAYHHLARFRDRVGRVLLAGPPHRVAVRGAATVSCDYFRTPLGDVAIDTVAARELVASGAVEYADAAHVPEHSLEVQLPFLQTVLGEFTLLPLLVGDLPPAAVAALLAPWWDAEDALVVVSTDLSHFLDYDTARTVDGDTDAAIRAFDPSRIDPTRACGCRALNGLLHLAAARAAGIERLALCNSGDTAGSRDRVVGYAAYALA
ncbi:MAG: AmmeMemoRadiSam system protein B [Gammaproteobacteria bacterium]|nr:AmmeMemoRadiSam system protein B [Gammaproteobacteria bacterium]MCP5202065.1 AmmeMemoRadiSam system protein B [Gammaproteobacteria bacterium]